MNCQVGVNIGKVNLKFSFNKRTIKYMKTKFNYALPMSCTVYVKGLRNCRFQLKIRCGCGIGSVGLADDKTNMEVE
jgi:hypothetical protein